MLKKIALVTGASRGIGAEVAKIFAQNGLYVYINYEKNKNAAEQVLEKIKIQQGEGEIIQTSINNKDEVLSMFEKIKKDKKRLDVLVNNAGVTQDSLFGLMSLQAWQKVIDTNLTGLYLCCQQAIKIFIAQRFGNMINLSSVSGIYGAVGQTNYAAAKAGIIAFTRSLAFEVGKYNIRVNAVAPGYIQTDMLAKIPFHLHKKIIEKCALERIGLPQEVAQVVNFLASESASYIQGQTLIVDGGLF
jgi:3-oxoacyl-[acyl-carrier protein] reductase